MKEVMRYFIIFMSLIAVLAFFIFLIKNDNSNTDLTFTVIKNHESIEVNKKVFSAIHSALSNGYEIESVTQYEYSENAVFVLRKTNE